MSANAPPRKTKEQPTNKETWKDWDWSHLEPRLLSHDELFEELRRYGIDIKPSTLEYWRKQGVVPRPVRMFHKGSVRPVYPDWLVGAIELLRFMQDQGHPLEDIKPWIRAYATSPRSRQNLTDPLALLSELADIRTALIPFVRGFEEVDKKKVSKVRIALLDEDGESLHERLIPIEPWMG